MHCLHLGSLRGIPVQSLFPEVGRQPVWHPVPEEGFQQKQPKPIELSSLSPDALKGVEVPTDKTPTEGVSDTPTTDSTEDSGHEFKVQIIRDGERITKMLVQCKCGETIPLDCVY